MSEDFPEIKIPFWMDGKHTRTLARASRRWWDEVGDWARFPLKQLDPMTCTDRKRRMVSTSLVQRWIRSPVAA